MDLRARNSTRHPGEESAARGTFTMFEPDAHIIKIRKEVHIQSRVLTVVIWV